MDTEIIRRMEETKIRGYLDYLNEQERTKPTVRQYARDLAAAADFLPEKNLSKTALLAWKEKIVQQYAVSTVNTMLAAVNGFLSFCGWDDLKLKPLKVQQKIFCDRERELSKEEYFRLVEAAGQRGNQRLALVLQTICGTGIRVSELQFITAEAVRARRVEVVCKGKRRLVFLPKALCKKLEQYLRKEKRTVGAVFQTKTGKPLDRSNIWREMKSLCQAAGVAPGKVFPHNLRHLFARTYYTMKKDLVRLADILGHTNINTTRIYTMESGEVHERQLNQLGLVTT